MALDEATEGVFRLSSGQSPQSSDRLQSSGHTVSFVMNSERRKS